MDREERDPEDIGLLGKTGVYTLATIGAIAPIAITKELISFLVPGLPPQYSTDLEIANWTSALIINTLPSVFTLGFWSPIPYYTSSGMAALGELYLRWNNLRSSRR